jgi:hypothetical protein
LRYRQANNYDPEAREATLSDFWRAFADLARLVSSCAPIEGAVPRPGAMERFDGWNKTGIGQGGACLPGDRLDFQSAGLPQMAGRDETRTRAASLQPDRDRHDHEIGSVAGRAEKGKVFQCHDPPAAG